MALPASRLLVAALAIGAGGCTSPSAPRDEVPPAAIAPSPDGFDTGYFEREPRAGLWPRGEQAAPAASRPELLYPARIAVSEGGAVCASDLKAGKVVCTEDERPGVGSAFRRPLTISGLDLPLGVALRGEQLLVGSLGRRSVEIYDLGARRYLGALGKGRDEFSMPNAIAVAPDGTAVVADSREDAVKIYGTDGKLERTLGGRGSANGQLLFPVAVAVDVSRIIVGDQGNHRLQIFDRDGNWLRSVGEAMPSTVTSTLDFRGRFSRIQGLALRGDETLVLDSYHSHVQVFDRDFVSQGFFGRQGDCPSCVALALDLAVDWRGRALVADPERGRWVYLPVLPR